MPTLRPIISLASRLADASRCFLERELSRAGHPDLEPCHGDVFAVLFKEDGLALTELAKRSGRSKSTISVMVRRLTALGYLEKIADGSDTRAVRIKLSAKGRKLKPLFLRISEDIASTLASDLTEAELEKLESLLNRSISSFDKHNSTSIL